jgi:hypothetical protein
MCSPIAISGSGDCTAKLWNLRNFEHLATLNCGKDAVQVQ